MGEPREVQPHDLLRAALDDTAVRTLLVELGVSPDNVRVTLERRWLDTVAALEPEVLEWRGISMATLVAALQPREGQHRVPVLSSGAREVMLRALREANTCGERPAGGHLLLGLVAARDPLVGSTMRDHGLRLRATRKLVRRSARRSG